MSHCVIGFGVIQQKLEVFINNFFIRSNQFQSSSFNPFWTLCRITHDQYRLTERGSLFLNSTAIRQN